MAGISVTGLISNSFDWQSVVDQLITIEKTPIARLQTEQAKNNDKLASLNAIRSYLTDLQVSAISLRSSTLFKTRVATSSTVGSTWTPSASFGATSGSFTFSVSQLATTSRRLGESGVSAKLAPDGDTSAVTLATANTSTAITAGKFTVNGQAVTVELTDTLDDVFAKISTATNGKVTASYNAASDKITLANTDENDTSAIELGAVNDTSNFLTAMRLKNNGTGAVTSSAKLGAVSLSATIAQAGLAGSLEADEDGNGKFSINGVEISYNVNTDTLRSVLNKINVSSAGVTASYDSANDRFVLTNNSTGDTGIGANEVSGGLLNAMGLTTGSSLERGNNALFTVNGGDTLESTSNTLSSDLHGITGLSLKVDSTGTQTITVGSDTETIKSAITDFIEKFNAVQELIEAETSITKGPDGNMVAATLGGNREVESWSRQLRAMAFDAIPDLSSTMSRLNDLGIDIETMTSKMVIKDESKLDEAIRNNSDDINGFFTNATNGFAQKFSSYLTKLLNSSNGGIATQQNTLTTQNKSIESQIETLNRRIEAQRELLTKAFLAMQDAQSAASSQQKTINDMFAKKSSDS